jgi:hypothetical protein
VYKSLLMASDSKTFTNQGEKREEVVDNSALESQVRNKARMDTIINYGGKMLPCGESGLGCGGSGWRKRGY